MLASLLKTLKPKDMISDFEQLTLLKDTNRHLQVILKMRDLTPPERKKVSINPVLLHYYAQATWDKDSEELLRIIGENEREIEKLVDANVELPKFITNQFN